MLVRKAKPEDHNSIVAFQLAMALETEKIELVQHTVKKGVAEVFKDSSKGQYFVVEKDKKIIGSLLTTYEWSDWRNGTILWIQSVYVLPEYRRQGAYSKLYAFIKNEVLHDTGLMGIRLYADKSNRSAHQVYHKLGMTSDHYITFEWFK
ncbi:MAG: GNAT family N-acetyltransferase [Mariniphaga sp.]|nr:GNAT family N-acetyltransferase [Mariniphaga sp.]MDD4227454.1 GNAT family N-acetyltransferase [Mariniphaga sp.]MDD4424588.1 GNAT family N-acetyltransferase [Mariniphaga sp.]